DRHGKAESPKVRGRRRGGQDRRGVGAHGEKSRDADIKQAAVAPLDVEAQREHRVDARHGRKKDEVGKDAFDGQSFTAPPVRKIPPGRTNKMTIMITKATTGL